MSPHTYQEKTEFCTRKTHQNAFSFYIFCNVFTKSSSQPYLCVLKFEVTLLYYLIHMNQKITLRMKATTKVSSTRSSSDLE